MWKKKQQSEEIEGIIIEDDGLGRTSIPIKMTGKANDPDIKYDTKAVRKKISSDLKKEKETIKKVFRDEFKWLHKKDEEKQDDSIVIIENQQNDFIIEWEESKPDSVKSKVKPARKKKPPTEDKQENEDFIIIWDEENDTIK
ncbi:MAG: hypothetical protein K8R37_12450 [Bacteroidales bacterium]|nr:hypothetical protein [Bacteroidales bacterium]